MCELKQQCDKLHRVLHLSGSEMCDDDWGRVSELSQKLLRIVNDEVECSNGVKVTALWLLLQTGIGEVETERQERETKTIH